MKSTRFSKFFNDSIQKGISPGGVAVSASLTAVKGVAIIYTSKGIVYGLTVLETYICPGVGTAIGFAAGIVHNACAEVQKVFKEFGVDSFDDLAAKHTPDEMISTLNDMGYSKTINLKNLKSPAIEMTSPNAKLTFRLQIENPQGGIPYFRVYNSGGGALNTTGIFPSWASRQELRLLTHFYFGGG